MPNSPWPSPVLFDDILPVLYLTITLSVQRLNHKNKKRYVSEPSSLSLSLAMLLHGCCYRWQTTTTRATSPGSSPMVVNSATLHATGGSNHGRGYVLTIPWVTMVEVPWLHMVGMGQKWSKCQTLWHFHWFSASPVPEERAKWPNVTGPGQTPIEQVIYGSNFRPLSLNFLVLKLIVP